MKLEKYIEKLVPELKTGKWGVIAYGLLHDGDGWTTNESWYLCRDAEFSEIMENIRGRWEVFKVNYLPHGRVCDISADGDETVYLDCEGIPFLEIRKAD